MSNLWMRKFEFSAGGVIIREPLTVKFAIPFSDTSDTNGTTIKVYNLKDSTIKGIKINTLALLQAGYVDDYGNVFNGYLKSLSTAWEGVDKVTSFVCADAPAAYLKDTYKKTYSKGTKASVIIRDVASFAGLKIGDIKLPLDFVYRSGKTLKGTPQTLLTGIAKDCKAKMHITKGALYMRDKNAGTNLGLEISKETGLLDHPELIENEVTISVPVAKQTTTKATAKTTAKDASGKKKETQTKVTTTKKTTTRTGYKLKMLLNPRIDTDVIIKLTSKTVSGTFRVEKGEHKGDTSGNEWFTECEVYPI